MRVKDALNNHSSAMQEGSWPSYPTDYPSMLQFWPIQKYFLTFCKVFLVKEMSRFSILKRKSTCIEVYHLTIRENWIFLSTVLCPSNSQIILYLKNKSMWRDIGTHGLMESVLTMYNFTNIFSYVTLINDVIPRS